MEQQVTCPECEDEQQYDGCGVFVCSTCGVIIYEPADWTAADAAGANCQDYP